MSDEPASIVRFWCDTTGGVEAERHAFVWRCVWRIPGRYNRSLL